MKIAIISPDYSSESYSSFSFVHARAKLYKKKQNEVEVFVLTDCDLTYDFEGITVNKTSEISFAVKIGKFEPDVLAVHYPTFMNIPFIRKLDYPKVSWLHGHEILWSWRLTGSQNGIDWIKKRMVIIPRLIVQLYSVRKFLQGVEFSVFVSKWLLKTAEKHCLCKFNNSVIIPNPVDTQLFTYRRPNFNGKGISVKSLEKTQYGVDIAIKAFSKLNEAHLTIVGTGRFFNKFSTTISRLKSNTRILNKSINHDDLPNLFYQYSYFVAPSRFDSQGLAMCEAMSCGLPVVTTRVGGIPEFVREGVDGYLVSKNNPIELQNAIVRLLSNRDKYYEMSRNASENIKSLCDSEIVVKKELEILEKARSK